MTLSPILRVEARESVEVCASVSQAHVAGFRTRTFKWTTFRVAFFVDYGLSQEDNDRFTLFLGSNLNDLKAIRQHLLKGISLKNNTFRPELEASQKEVWSRCVPALPADAF